MTSRNSLDNSLCIKLILKSFLLFLSTKTVEKSAKWIKLTDKVHQQNDNTRKILFLKKISMWFLLVLGSWIFFLSFFNPASTFHVVLRQNDNWIEENFFTVNMSIYVYYLIKEFWCWCYCCWRKLEWSKRASKTSATTG